MTVEELIKNKDFETQIPINNIVGIDETDELVYIENIHLNGACSRGENLYLDIHGYTFRKITNDDIEERRSPEYAENERDMWVIAVQDGYTDSSLEDWWEELCDEADGLYPYDDNSFRYELEKAYENLNKKNKEAIEEEWGIKGNPDEDTDSEVNQNSDWVTGYCGTMGSVISHNGYYVGSPETALERVVEWKVNLYPQLINFLAKTHDKLLRK